MKTIGKILGILLACSVLLIAVVVIFIATFDWDKARPWIGEKVTASTGRNFAIDGHLAVHWRRPADESGWRGLIPHPTFTAEKLRVGNPDWAKQPQFASADAVTFDLAVLPLLTHEVVISKISLTNPVVDLERTADGRNTWTFKPADKNKSKWDVQLHELLFADGVLTVADEATRIDMQATISTLGQPVALGDLLARQRAAAAGAAASKSPAATKSETAAQGKPPVTAKSEAAAQGKPPAMAKSETAVPGEPPAATTVSASDAARYGFGVELAGKYRDAKLAGKGKIGGALSLVDNTRPFPLEFDVHLGDNHLTVAGTLTNLARLAAIDVQLTLAAPSMSDLYDLSGVSLPDTPKFQTTGHLTGTFQGKEKHFKYEKFSGSVGRSDLAGTLEYNAGQTRPKLTGSVHSKRLALADLGPAIGGPRPGAGKPAKKPAAPSTRGDRKVAAAHNPDSTLPRAEFRTERWRAMDADVLFTGASILRSEALPINDMSTHIIMDNGVLIFDPLKFGVAGGTMTGTIRLDGGSQPLQGKIDVAARHLQLKRLFPAFNPMNTSFGEINGDAKLTGRGNSIAAIAATSNGEVKLLINDGAISSTLLEEAGLNVANIVAAKLFGDKVVAINCAAADFVVKDGLLDSRYFAFDTIDALINVDGTVNLANEQMMLNVYPHTKGFRIFSLRSPLYVKGTFRKPDVGVMKGPLAVRAAAALALGAINPVASLLALLAPSNNQASPCPQMMADASKSLKGAPALSPATKK